MESLKLVQAFPFLDQVEKETKQGNRYFCAARTQERKDLFGGHVGWLSMGDMITGDNTEDFAMVRDLDVYKKNVTDDGTDNGADILTDRIYPKDYPEITAVGHKKVDSVFFNKTQGEASHLYLLAVACLITDRFPDAAMVFGDISAGQCRAAVRWAKLRKHCKR